MVKVVSCPKTNSGQWQSQKHNARCSVLCWNPYFLRCGWQLCPFANARSHFQVTRLLLSHRVGTGVPQEDGYGSQHPPGLKFMMFWPLQRVPDPVWRHSGQRGAQSQNPGGTVHGDTFAVAYNRNQADSWHLEKEARSMIHFPWSVQALDKNTARKSNANFARKTTGNRVLMAKMQALPKRGRRSREAKKE